MVHGGTCNIHTIARETAGMLGVVNIGRNYGDRILGCDYKQRAVEEWRGMYVGCVVALTMCGDMFGIFRCVHRYIYRVCV